MKKKIALIALKLLLFCSCSTKNNNTPEVEEKDEKKTFMVLSSGDTLFTGIPLKLKKEEIALGHVKKVPLKKEPQVYKANNNVYDATPPKAIKLPSISNKLNELKPKKSKLGNDTILSGIELDIRFEKSKKMGTARYKDNAIYDIQCVGLDEGLSQYIYSILEDSRGYIWFGHYFEGLTRFDGKEFVNFNGGDGILSETNVWTMIEDHQGNLWFSCTTEGVVKYNGKTFIQYSTKNGFLSDNVFGLVQDANDNIWFATDKGIVKYNGECFTNYTVDDGLSGNIVISALQDSKGNIWFGTTQGVTVFSQSKFITYTDQDGLPPRNVISIFEDSSNNIWLGTYDGGLCKYDGENLEIFTTNEGLQSNSIKGIQEDSNGNLWFASNIKGLSKYDGKKFQHISIKEGLPNDRIRTLLIDSKQNLWAGTQGGGAFKFNINSFTSSSSNPQSNETLAPMMVYSIYEDQKDNIWYVNVGGEFSKYDGESYTVYGKEQGLGYYDIFELITDSQDNIWFGSWSGLIKFDGNYFYEYTRKTGLKHQRILDLIENNNNIWFIGYDTGLGKLDGNTISYYTISNSRNENKALCVFEDSLGNVWFGTEKFGMCKYNVEEDTFIFYTENEGLAGNYVLSITEDANNNIWASTSGGASRFNGTSFTNFSKKEGVIVDGVSSVTEDFSGNLWLTTMRGLSCIVTDQELVDKVDENKRVDEGKAFVVNFDKKDGLKSIDFFQNTLADSQNILRFSTSNGLINLDLNTYNFSSEAPVLRMNTIEINEQFIDYNALNNKDYLESLGVLSNLNKYASHVKSFNNYPEKLFLPHNYNHLNFKFSAIDWKSPDAVKFSFKIEGLDEKWSTPSNNNYADYRNIPAGNYVFKVKAISKSAQWSKPIEYPFSIVAPWWLNGWAKMIYVVLFVLLLVFSFKWYNMIMRRKQVALENIVDERTAIISQQKEALKQANKNLEQERNKMELKALINQINPHFVFNTLNSIQQFIISNNTKNSLDYFNKFGKLIRSSLEHSEMKFVSIQEEIAVIQNYVALENLRFSEPVLINFHTKDVDVFNVQIPPMFIQPIIENAIIHGFCKKEKDKEIKVSFEEFEGHVLCAIIDNGIGIKNTKSSKNKNSGLVITQKRLESVWGVNKSSKTKIFMKDIKNEGGTIVKIKLPKYL